ncbi:MAG TPA: fatty acid CoA ligase family protein [Lacipirellulaceae bacterium]|jgi:acyl-CoA synthetase (AMP-forming)/AMP-acid ligase II
MADVRSSPTANPAARLSVADRLAEYAAKMPDAIAVACPYRSSPHHHGPRRGLSGAKYATISFTELDASATRLARGLLDWGIEPGARLALLVRPGIDFVTLIFALLRAGAVTALIDPGIGRRNLVRCLADAELDGFIAVSAAQCMRALLRHKFPQAKRNITVGRRWGWAGPTLQQLGERGALADHVALPQTHADDPAAIIFTSGSTGPPKGVLYTHRMFDTQVTEIQSTYSIAAGGVDLSCFPLFALFNSAMGVTTVLPEMDFSRPAAASPLKLLDAAEDWQVTQAFASPAVWKRLSNFCALTGQRINSLRQVFSCGAPVPADVIEATLDCVAPDAKLHTPYGATECLPVATIEAAEILDETSQKTNQGGGICVGRPFESIEWRVVRICDGPIPTIDAAEEMPTGEIGELVVRGPQASPCYVTRKECNALSKIAIDAFGAPIADFGFRNADSNAPTAFRNPNSEIPWHRMGDVGYLDDSGRFWYCGRKSHRVETADGTLYTECVEAVFNAHDDVERTALVGVGPRGRQAPVLIVEPTRAMCRRHGSEWSPGEYQGLLHELRALSLRHPSTRQIAHFLLHQSLPVDVRHNAKIFREQLTHWAARRLPELR